jgi:hypothetical protein
LTTWHIGGRSELIPARRGYRLMHDLYVGHRWKQAAREMWDDGVRYVIVNRGNRMQSPTLDRFSSFSSPYLVRSWPQQAEVERYMARLTKIAEPLGSVHEYHGYLLDPTRLFATASTPRPPAPHR